MTVTLYMDRHELGNATADELAQAHICDLQVQDKYGVRFVTYWYHHGAATGFCLLEAPDRSAAEAAHREAHGNLACEIIEVEWGAVESYLGRIREPAPGEVWEENPLRAIVCTELDASLLPAASGKKLVRRALNARGGQDIERDGGVLGCFPSASAALEYGLAMQESFSPLASFYSRLPVRPRIGIAVGEPLHQGFGLFGEVTQTASVLCGLASPGETLVSGETFALCENGCYRLEEAGHIVGEDANAASVYFRLTGRQPTSSLRNEPTAAPDGLSRREIEVLRLIAEGRTNKEIADILVISLSTVTTHVRNIFEKASLANRAEAAAYAFRHRLVPASFV
jgi:DNA-binding CsgD family transcriptional regulator